MRTYLLLLVFFVACLIPSAIVISGYGRQTETASSVSGSEPTSVSAAPTSGNRAAVADDDRPDRRVAAGPNDDVREAQNPLIRGMRQMLKQTFNSSELDDERGQLEQSLLEADTLLSKAKRQNRDALRQANRQVRIRGPQSPNVLFILVNELDSNDLGCCGGANALTPNIDRLASGGVRFTNFYSASPRPAASRWSLMTGLHTGHAGQVGEDSIALRNEEISLAEMLWHGGYATGAIGLWELPFVSKDASPNDHGFDEWLGYRDKSEALELYPQKLWSDRGQVKVVANADGKSGASAIDLFTQEALSFIDRHHRERPFFLLLSYPNVPSGNDAATRAEGITSLDSHIGRTIEHLRQLEIYEHTIVVLTSDKDSSLDEADIRRPLIVNGPSPIRTEAVSEHVCAMWDLYPTLGKLTAVQRQPRVDGLSLYPELIGERQAEHRFLAWGFDGNGTPRAARIGKWKIESSKSGEYRVYDLEDDPAAKINVAVEHPEAIEEFESLFTPARTSKVE